MHYLITGGLGYIGGHMAILLHAKGHKVTIVDNLSNSSTLALERLQTICDYKLRFSCIDIRNEDELYNYLKSINDIEKINGVFHFAGLKSVSESVMHPEKYYENNVVGTEILTKTISSLGIFNFIFSSSATVYGDPERLPVDEECRTSSTNPYGESKLLSEIKLMDLANSDPRWKIVALRYFNPVGAHESGLFGESPKGVPNNLMPYVFDVAIGDRECVSVFGNSYDTIDGTGVRDYIHVMDLVEGHLATLTYLDKNSGFNVFNLGCGKGYSVLEMIKTTANITCKNIPYNICAPRSGDLGTVYASTSKAENILGWKSKKTLNDMIIDQWRWQKNKQTKIHNL